jgi:hypothetical protein
MWVSIVLLIMLLCYILYEVLGTSLVCVLYRLLHYTKQNYTVKGTMSI